MILKKNEITVAPLFGYQGCGKGTISEGLGRAVNGLVGTVSPGELLRQARKLGERSPYHRLFADYYAQMDRGQILPAEVMEQALALEIRRLAEEGKRIVILDGYPRNAAQQKGLTTVLREAMPKRHVPKIKAVELRVSRETALKRIATRVQDSGEQARQDDLDREALERRLRTYEEATLPVVRALESAGQLQVICGERGKREVFKEAFEVLILPTVKKRRVFNL
jgi:adenylate kinase family enzyme